MGWRQRKFSRYVRRFFSWKIDVSVDPDCCGAQFTPGDYALERVERDHNRWDRGAGGTGTTTKSKAEKCFASAAPVPYVGRHALAHSARHGRVRACPEASRVDFTECITTAERYHLNRTQKNREEKNIINLMSMLWLSLRCPETL